jgi:aminoglycoside 3-N-acetyltransferase
MVLLPHDPLDELQIHGGEIAAGLAQLGVAEGDLLVVHSSLSSFGRVVGGAPALIQALLEVLGPRGTLMVPTMTFQACALPTSSPSAYHPRLTPCDQTMGVVPETLRQLPGVLRSGHPLVSVAAVGPRAQLLVESQTLHEPYAPYRVAAGQGGKVLLLGVGHTRNSTVHAAEFLAGLPYATGSAQVPWVALVSTPAGPSRVVLRSVAGCSEGFGRLDGLVPERRQLIGFCQARLMAAQPVIDAALALLRSEPAPFLCDDFVCPWCSVQREQLGR